MLGAQPNELALVAFLVGLITFALKVGPMGEAVGRWWYRRTHPQRGPQRGPERGPQRGLGPSGQPSAGESGAPGDPSEREAASGEPAEAAREASTKPAPGAEGRARSSSPPTRRGARTAQRERAATLEKGDDE